MTVSIYIAHAGWDGRRYASVHRLNNQVKGARIVASTEKEHASVWATRIWRRAIEGEEHAVFLNDDVTVPARFDEVCAALVQVYPDDVIALHATVNSSAAKLRWLAGYWVTGPGYIIPRKRLPALLEFADKWRDLFTPENHVNEDQILMQWLWSEQTPARLTIPALVKHDVSIPSTLGYDHHAMRRAELSWEEFPWADLTSVEFWREGSEKPDYVECPWMPTVRLRGIQARGGVTKCAACEEANPFVEFGNGNGICRRCLAKAASNAIAVTR